LGEKLSDKEERGPRETEEKTISRDKGLEEERGGPSGRPVKNSL